MAKLKDKTATIPLSRCEVFAVAVAGIFFLTLTSCKKAEAVVPDPKAGEVTAAQPQPENPSVTVEQAQLGAITVEVAKTPESVLESLTGRLVWDESCTVRVFSSVAGRIDHIFVNSGQKVKAGETLATLFSPDFGQAQSDASKAEADFKLAERTLIRTKDLLGHGAAAKKDLEAAEDDFESKKAERARALARLSLYGVNAGDVDGLFPMKAPLSGLLVEKNVNPGQEVRPDQMLANDSRLVQPLFVISDPSRLSILVDVTELDISTLKPDQNIRIRTKAFPDRIFNGKLEYISASLDPLTRTVKVRGSVDNAENLLKAEMYVAADVETGGDNTPSVMMRANWGDGQLGGKPKPVEISTKALFMKDNRYYVFIEKQPGTYERREVQKGAERQGRAYLTAGLNPGERVVSEGCLLLQSKSEAGK